MNLPGIIKKLDIDVVNRIAAGEVIQRPSNALKELLENSLDAKSSSIQVTVKNGGLKLLQIQDNGTGIRCEDLSIVCERYTTSKISKFEDLNSICTFGFRGEALSSITHVAHLSITTKTVNQKACYEDGKLIGQPKPCAGNQGTMIVVEDLFYNVTTRKQALHSSEEYTKVAEVISRYAIHNPSVGFSLKKQGELVSIKTNAKSSHIDNIRAIYGEAIARELIEIESTDSVYKCTVHGYVTNANYSTKKSIFILFINNRLVDSAGLRKTLENFYAALLPKGSYPFIYLSLSLDPKNVDVNVHPTKHEVIFLHEAAIIDNIKLAIEDKLLGSKSRVLYQTKLPSVDLDLKTAVLEKSGNRQNTLVRTDANVQKIDKFLSRDPEHKKHAKQEIKLTSVLKMRQDIETSSNAALREIVANSVFVGCVDANRALVQHSTELYMFNIKKLKEELFYQLVVYDFANLGAIKFQTPLPIRDLALLGLDDPQTGWKEEDGNKEDIAINVVKTLIEKKDMLIDYFSIEIDDLNNLCAIPMVIESYIPDPSKLPLFILKLACDVEWSAEQPCFETISREIAKYFSYTNTTEKRNGRDWEWTTEHVVYEALKKSLQPSKELATNSYILQLASLPDLYKVFERC